MTKELRNRYILLDTCVVSNALSNKRDLSQKTLDFLLKDQSLNNNHLFISGYTHYEILKGIDPESREKENAAKEYLKTHITIDPTVERLQRAAKLFSAYAKNDQTKKILNGISDVDIFIGSLIFTDHKPVLLTTDFNDFPRPFFREIAYRKVEYEKKPGQLACQYYYYLEADLDLLM